MSDYIGEIGKFLWAVINNWAGYTTGGLVVALLWLWSTLRQIQISRKIGIAVALVFLFFAIFNAWREKHHQVLQLQQELEVRSKPKLSIEVAQMVSGVTDDDNTQVFMEVDVRNAGAPSVAYAFSLSVDNGAAGVKLDHERPTIIPDGFQIIDKGKIKAQFSKENRLEERVGDPIKQGDLKGGWIRFILPVKSEYFSTAKKTLWCKDVTKTEVKYEFVNLAQEGLQYYPEGGKNPFNY